MISGKSKRYPDFLRLLRLASPYKWWMLLAAGMAFLTVGSSVGLLMTSAYIIAKAALQPSIAELQVAIAGVRFFGIARGVFRYLERFFSHQTTFYLLTRFRVWFYRAMEPLAPAGLARFCSGDLLSRLVADVESLEHIYVRVLAPPVVAVCICLLMFFLFGQFSAIFAIVLLICLLTASLALPLLTYRLTKRVNRRVVRLRSRFQEMATDGVQGLAELLVFGRAAGHFNQLSELSDELLTLQRRSAGITAFHESLTGLLMNFSVLAILTVAIPKVSSLELNGVYLSVLVLGTMAAFEAVSPLPVAVQSLEEALQAARRLFQITDSEPEVKFPGKPVPVPSTYSLELAGVSFRYHPADPLVLENITLCLNPGEKIVIVGHSAAGKTSLINLLLRFYKPSAGSIRLGSVDLSQIGQQDLQQIIGVVPQETFLFSGTIRENLLLAAPQATDAELEEALLRARLQQWIGRLPAGLNTDVGERGLQISGGERRRLALARCYLRNSPIQILDEPTADLDTVTAQGLMQSVLEDTRNQILLVITHRLTGLEQFDRIVVLEQGRIVEQGTHRELLVRRGEYARMWQIQKEENYLAAVPAAAN